MIQKSNMDILIQCERNPIYFSLYNISKTKKFMSIFKKASILHQYGNHKGSHTNCENPGPKYVPSKLDLSKDLYNIKWMIHIPNH